MSRWMIIVYAEAGYMFYPKNAEELEKRLKDLASRRRKARVVKANKVVGRIEPIMEPGHKRYRWHWWYDPSIFDV